MVEHAPDTPWTEAWEPDAAADHSTRIITEALATPEFVAKVLAEGGAILTRHPDGTITETDPISDDIQEGEQ